MSVHLKEETLVEVAEGGGAAESRAHAAACPSCATRIEEAREALSALQRTEVPEPPPLFWEAFRRNVGRRIAEEHPSRAWRRWLLPLAALSATAAIAMVAQRTILTNGPGRAGGTEIAVATPLPPWSALPPAEEDEGMSVLEGLALDGSDLAELYEGRGLESYIAGLTDEEATLALSGDLWNASEGGAL